MRGDSGPVSRDHCSAPKKECGIVRRREAQAPAALRLASESVRDKTGSGFQAGFRWRAPSWRLSNELSFLEWIYAAEQILFMESRLPAAGRADGLGWNVWRGRRDRRTSRRYRS